MKRLYTTFLSIFLACGLLGTHGGFAAAWTSPDTLSATADNSSQVSVAINASGASVAAWQDDTDFKIYASTRAAGLTSTWSTPTAISAAGTGINQIKTPEAAINDNGDIFVIWENKDNDSIQGSFKPSSASFSSVKTTSGTGTTVDTHKIAMNNNVAAIVWRQNPAGADNNLIQANLYNIASDSFEGVTSLTATGKDASSPQVAVDSSNNIAVIWDRPDVTTDNKTIQVKLRSGSGTWAGAPTVDLSDASQAASEPHIGLDQSGNPVAVWKRSDGTNNIVQSSCWNGTAWTTPVNLSPSGETATALSFVINASGTAAVTWQQVTTDVTLRVIKAAFLKDLATCSWASPVVVSTTSGNEAELPKVGIDQFGNVIIIWNVAYTSNSDEQIQSRYYLHSDSTWRASETVVVSTRSAGVQYSATPALGVGSGGSGVAGWVNTVLAGTTRIQAAYFAVSYPPFQMIAKRMSNRFFTQTDYYNKLSWSNYTATKPTLYRITRGTQFMGTVSGQDSLKFEDHNRNKNVLETYQFSTINTNGGESFPFNFTVTR